MSYFSGLSSLIIIITMLHSISFAQWTQTSSGINRGDIRSVAVNGNNVFAGTNLYGVFKSTDNGTSWNQTSLNNRTVYSIATIGQKIYAGTSLYGLYVSTRQWQHMDSVFHKFSNSFQQFL
ncbi:MAG: hypothetical protein IPL67_17915 [Ignavibacteria bacterium]|nr:hypothetical protein [Ignavibacteria bacterium]